MGVRELEGALEPLHFTGGERRAKKHQIRLSFDSRGALLAYIYNNEDHK
jgi:hypothetical protein